MTMSEFVRNLIKLSLALNEKNVINNKNDINDLDIDKFLMILGGIKNI